MIAYSSEYRVKYYTRQTIQYALSVQCYILLLLLHYHSTLHRPSPTCSGVQHGHGLGEALLTRLEHAHIDLEVGVQLLASQLAAVDHLTGTNIGVIINKHLLWVYNKYIYIYISTELKHAYKHTHKHT